VKTFFRVLWFILPLLILMVCGMIVLFAIVHLRTTRWRP
jgi:hypothetical protein